MQICGTRRCKSEIQNILAHFLRIPPSELTIAENRVMRRGSGVGVDEEGVDVDGQLGEEGSMDSEML